MADIYRRAFKNSLLGHGIVVLLAVIVTFCAGWVRRRPVEIPIEFTVVVEAPQEVAPKPSPRPARPLPPPPKPPPPADAVVQVKKIPDPPKPKPQPDPPKPEPPKPEPPKPEPPKPEPPKPDPPKPEPSKPAPANTFKKGERVVREVPVNVPPVKLARQPMLSAEEIARLLAAGARVGEENVIPQSEVQRCFLLVKQALYNSWNRPSRSDAGARPAEIELAFGSGGVVTGARLIHSSGSAIHDSSAVEAGRAVGRVSGLSARFLQQYPRVTVDFELE